MLVRTAAIALFALATVPAAAQTVLDSHAEHGAMAGRSPHKAYRPMATASGCEAKALPSLPGGKLPVYGRPARPAGCDEIARAGAGAGVAAGEQ